MSRVVIFGGTLVAALAVLTPPASACSVPRTGWTVGAPVDLEDVPIEGVLWLPSRYVPSGSLDEVNVEGLSATVTDEAGVEVPGRLEYAANASALLWRASSTLTASSRYRAKILAWDAQSSSYEVAFEFRTRAEPLGPLVPAVFESIYVEEAEVVLDRSCCPIDPGACTCGPPCQQCWTTSVRYRPRIRADVRVSGPRSDLPVTSIEILQPDGQVEVHPKSLSAGELLGVSLYTHTDSPRHCARVRTRRLVDGASTATDWTCIEAADVRPANPREPEGVGDTSACLEPPTSTGGVVPLASTGCQASGDGELGLVVFAGLVLFTRRRRGTARSDGTGAGT